MALRVITKCSVRSSFKTALDQNHVGMLNHRMDNGNIVWWKYRPFILSLGEHGTYEPTFATISKQGTLSCETVSRKGVVEDTAMIKVAACIYPFINFKLAHYNKKGIENKTIEWQSIINRGDFVVEKPAAYQSNIEQAYAGHLMMLAHAKQILWCSHEPINLRLAPRTYYLPDFMYLNSDGQLWIDEVKAFRKNKNKAHWEDDALVKIKVAAELHPYLRFRGVTKKMGTWEYRYFEPQGKFITERPMA